MSYAVFVTIPTKIEVEAPSAEEAVKMVRENLIKSGRIRSTDRFEITVAKEIKVGE